MLLICELIYAGAQVQRREKKTGKGKCILHTAAKNGFGDIISFLTTTIPPPAPLRRSPGVASPSLSSPNRRSGDIGGFRRGKEGDGEKDLAREASLRRMEVNVKIEEALRNVDTGGRDNMGRTPLHYAAMVFIFSLAPFRPFSLSLPLFLPFSPFSLSLPSPSPFSLSLPSPSPFSLSLPSPSPFSLLPFSPSSLKLAIVGWFRSVRERLHALSQCQTLSPSLSRQQRCHASPPRCLKRTLTHLRDPNSGNRVAGFGSHARCAGEHAAALRCVGEELRYGRGDIDAWGIGYTNQC
jgi:hypothetical protein